MQLFSLKCAVCKQLEITLRSYRWERLWVQDLETKAKTFGLVEHTGIYNTGEGSQALIAARANKISFLCMFVGECKDQEVWHWVFLMSPHFLMSDMWNNKRGFVDTALYVFIEQRLFSLLESQYANL